MNFLGELSEAAELQEGWEQYSLGSLSTDLCGLGVSFNHEVANAVSQQTPTVGKEILPRDFFRYSKSLQGSILHSLSGFLQIDLS